MQKQIDWNKLLQYTDRYHSKAAVKRLGFIIEMLDLNTKQLSRIQQSVACAKDYIFLDPKGPKTGHYLSRWHCRVNMNIDELKASIWE